MVNEQNGQWLNVMIETKLHKFVDKFMQIDISESKIIPGFSMYIRQLGSNTPFKRISVIDFQNKYCLNKQETFMANSMKMPKGYIIGNSCYVVPFFKGLAQLNKEKVMYLDEKHIGIEMVYGYGLTADKAMQVYLSRRSK